MMTDTMTGERVTVAEFWAREQSDVESAERRDHNRWLDSRGPRVDGKVAPR